MSKLSHEIRALKDEIVRLEKQQGMVAVGVAKIIDLLKGGIKIEVRPPQTQTQGQRKIIVAGPNVKIESKRRSP